MGSLTAKDSGSDGVLESKLRMGWRGESVFESRNGFCDDFVPLLFLFHLLFNALSVRYDE
jgi:hypothetical protein